MDCFPVISMIMRLLQLILLIFAIFSPLSEQVESKRNVLFNKVLPWIDGLSFAQLFDVSTKVSSSLEDPRKFSDDFTIKFPLESSEVKCREILAKSKNTCALHLHHILKKLGDNKKEISLITFIDSFAKPSAGIRNGNLDWIGHERQCEMTRVMVPSSPDAMKSFQGKYCRAEWNTSIGSNYLTHSTGICIPNSCGTRDVRYLKIFLKEFSFLKISQQSHVSTISCKKGDELDANLTIFYSICFILILFGIFSSIYDKFSSKNTKIMDTKLSILSAFSIHRNWHSLYHDKVSKNQIIIIDYVRALCTLLLIFWHAIAILSLSFSQNPENFLNTLLNMKPAWLSLRSVLTTYFFLTGFLIRPDHTKPGQNFSPFKSIAKLFIRLFPSYYFCILARVAYLGKFGLGSGLAFGIYEIDRSLCMQLESEEFSFFHNRPSAIILVSYGTIS